MSAGDLPSRRHLLRAPRLFTLLLMFFAGAQAEQLPVKLYTTADGLWSSNTTCLMRDSHGFLWFCTREGVSRFDGYRFVNYRIGSEPGSQHVAHVLETRDGIFWFVMNRGGLYRYDPSTLSSRVQEAATSPAGADGRILLPAQLVSRNLLQFLYEDSKGNLWAGNSGLSLIENRNNNISFRHIELGLPQGPDELPAVSNPAEGSDGSLWLSTSRGLVRRLPDGQTIRFNLGPQRHVATSLAVDGKNRLWIGYDTAFYVLQIGPPPARPSPLGISPRVFKAPHNMASLELALATLREGEVLDLSEITHGRQVHQIYPHSNGQIWIAFWRELLLFDGGHFHRYVLGHDVGWFAEDLDGELWMGGPTGVMKLSLEGMVTYRTDDGLLGTYILSFYEDHQGGFFAISRPWFVSRLEEGKFNTHGLNLPAPGPMWTSPGIFRDHSGQWWALSSQGLYRFPSLGRGDQLARASPTAVYTTLDGLPGRYVYCMFEDSRGDLWISIRGNNPYTDVHGLVRWQRSTGTFHRLTEAEGLPAGKSAMSFAEDKAGNLWFGFYGGGVLRYAAGQFTSFTAGDGAPEAPVTALHIDHAGRLWLATSEGGVSRSDDPTAAHPRFVRYTTREGLSSDNVRCITEDLNGRIYFGSVRGVDRLTPETGRVKHFGMPEGLAGDFVTSAHRDHQGSLWFGTYNGLSRLDPQPDRVSAPAPILIDGLRIAGLKLPVAEFGAAAIGKLELSSAQSNLQIDFFSLSMARAASLRYQYKLEGSDRDWGPPISQRSVHYANLAPGNYRFLVRAVDASGVTSPQPATVSFRILSPLWQRWWFLSLVTLAVAAAVHSLYRYRTARLVELERVRTRIATDLHDDIGASLSQISLLSEVAQRRADGHAAVSRPLSTIASTSRELLEAMDDIVWSINPARDRLGDLSQRMRRFAGDLFMANNVEFRFAAREAEASLKLDAEVRRQVFLIFKEAVNNIARHSRCANVKAELGIEKHSLTLTVADDGKGFDTAQDSHGHGLMSMRRRAELLGGVLIISSRPEGGTTVSLQVPLARRAASVAHGPT